MNLGINFLQGNIHSLTDGLAAFGIGAVGGAISGAMPGMAGSVFSGLAVGSGNSWLSGGSFSDIIVGGIAGATSGALGYKGGEWGSRLGTVVVNGTKVDNSYVRSAVVGTVAGATSNAASSFAIGLLLTGDFEKAVAYVKDGLITGGFIGATSGIASAYIEETIPVNKLESDVAEELKRIWSKESNPHRNDGGIFRNKEQLLPLHGDGYYREYVVPTDKAGIKIAGKRRVVIGKMGEYYYTSDHYHSFIRFRYETLIIDWVKSLWKSLWK